MDVLLAPHANLSKLNHGLGRQDTEHSKDLQASVAVLGSQSFNGIKFAVQVVFENVDVVLL
jgi:hypothetical protein